MGSSLARFLKGYTTHYADVVPHNLTLPNYIPIQPCCLTLDRDSWFFYIAAGDLLPACRIRGRRPNRVDEVYPELQAFLQLHIKGDISA